ncbi:hypothetical protein A6A04_12340 [Paramagnetospirillum marisnigri]|uniref:Uncharacterized protein n=1 Tax=Paramagnetospirillum marisnigri TaxID=1285242 RepID=A0A178MX93_9PROT|nr:hypothetical protein A6A04_12340 [Paramagnetospirillum marisnigri]
MGQGVAIHAVCDAIGLERINVNILKDADIVEPWREVVPGFTGLADKVRRALYVWRYFITASIAEDR